MYQAGSGPERCRAAASSMRAGRSWIQWGSAGPAGTADLHHHPLDGPAGVTASALDFVIGTSDGLDGAGQGAVAPAADLTREVADHPVGHPQAAGAGPGAGDLGQRTHLGGDRRDDGNRVSPGQLGLGEQLERILLTTGDGGVRSEERRVGNERRRRTGPYVA